MGRKKWWKRSYLRCLLCIAVCGVMVITAGCSPRAAQSVDTVQLKERPAEMLGTASNPETGGEPGNQGIQKSDVITAFQDAGYQILRHYEGLKLHKASQGKDKVYTMHISLGMDEASLAMLFFLDDGRIYLRSVINSQPRERTKFSDLNGDGVDDIVFFPHNDGADNTGGDVYVFSVEEDRLATLLVVAYNNTDQGLKPEYKDYFFHITDQKDIMHDASCPDYTEYVSGFKIIDAKPEILCINHIVGHPERGMPFTYIQWVDNKPEIVRQGFVEIYE